MVSPNKGTRGQLPCPMRLLVQYSIPSNFSRTSKLPSRRTKEPPTKFVAVNPLHVKKSKELDDNSPTKNDVKDAKVIAQLVKDGRYAEPTIPQGVYAELRVAKKIRDLLTEDLQTVQGQVHNWIDRYFPEFLTVFKKWEGKAALQFLKVYALPHEIVNFTEHELLAHLRKTVTRSVGLSKIRKLKQAASRSIGLRQGSEKAKLELKTLLAKYELIHLKFEELDTKIDCLLDEIPGVPQMLAIKGVGRDTVAGFFAEVGDLKEYTHPRQIIKLAGLSLKENTSGKHKGKTTITKRGRKKLRALLFRGCISLISHICTRTRSLYENCRKSFRESEGRFCIQSFFLCTVELVFKEGIKKCALANGIC